MALSSKPVLLFVCAANTCHSPMAQAVARAKLGDKVDVYSAGCMIYPGGDNYIMPYAERAIRDKLPAHIAREFNNRRSQQLKDVLAKVSGNVFIVAFGKEIEEKVKRDFRPKEKVAYYIDEYKKIRRDFKSKGKVEYYIDEYKGRASGEKSHNVPDPYDGEHWNEYFDMKRKPWRGLNSYEVIMTKITKEWTPDLIRRLGIKSGDKLLFVSTGNACLARLTQELFQREVKIGGVKIESAVSSIKPHTDTHFPYLANEALSQKYKMDFINEFSYLLTEDMIKGATYVISFSEDITRDITTKFGAYSKKVHPYCIDPKTKMTDNVPNPYDGQYWEEYFRGSTPFLGQESYNIIIDEMISEWQDKLTKRLGLTK